MTTGRPAHKPTDTERRAVETMAAFGIAHDKICHAIGIGSRTTLAKHYSTELERGAVMLEANLSRRLLEIAKGPDATALKAIMFILKCRFGWSEYAVPPALGKKAQADADANGDLPDDWAELLQ